MRYFLLCVIFLGLFSIESAFAKQFTVVIDAGHGGHDSGAVGRHITEKKLNLAVTLLVGKMIEENYPDIKVVYTRKTDRFFTVARESRYCKPKQCRCFSMHPRQFQQKLGCLRCRNLHVGG